MAQLFKMELQGNQLLVLLDVAQLNLTPRQVVEMGLAVRDSGVKIQARAVQNVSGYPVQYEGGVFRVKVQTGALKGAIDVQYPYQSPLGVRVFVNGTVTSMPTAMGGISLKPRPVSAYAGAIEFGHEPIDLKKHMLGKTVPFFASRSENSQGPYSARGLTPAGGDLWENKPLNAKLAAQGKRPMRFKRHRTKAAYDGAKKGAGSYYIAFRKVGKTGWVIPAAKPRPFMRAALSNSTGDIRQITGAQLRTVMAASVQPNR